MARGIFTGGANANASELNDCFNPPCCRARWTGAAINIATGGVGQAITLNTENYDVGPMHDVAVNNSRMTCPVGGGGLYTMGGNAEIAANAAGRRELGIRLNGVTFLDTIRIPPTAADATRLEVSTEYRLAPGDYVELMVFQNSGGALLLTTSVEYSAVFWIRWVAV